MLSAVAVFFWLLAWFSVEVLRLIKSDRLRFATKAQKEFVIYRYKLYGLLGGVLFGSFFLVAHWALDNG